MRTDDSPSVFRVFFVKIVPGFGCRNDNRNLFVYCPVRPLDVGIRRPQCPRSLKSQTKSQRRRLEKSGRSRLTSNRFMVGFLVLFGGFFSIVATLKSGPIQWGDWLWISPPSLESYQRLPAVWESMFGLGNTNAQINIGPVYWVMGQFGQLGLSAPTAERLLVFLPMALLPFLSMYWFLRRVDLSPTSRAAGALIFGANSYMMTRGVQHMFIVLGAGCAPLVWAAAVDAVRTAQSQLARTPGALFKRSLLLGLTFALTVMFDVRMALLALFPVSPHLWPRSAGQDRTQTNESQTFAVGLGIAIALQLYWVLPAVLGGGGSPASRLPDSPFVNNYSLPHALALSDPYYNGAEPVWFAHYQVMLPLLVLPVACLRRSHGRANPKKQHYSFIRNRGLRRRVDA